MEGKKEVGKLKGMKDGWKIRWKQKRKEGNAEIRKREVDCEYMEMYEV